MDEKCQYTVTFHFPEEESNSAQYKKFSFTMCADAVQTKNDPVKLLIDNEVI